MSASRRPRSKGRHLTPDSPKMKRNAQPIVGRARRAPAVPLGNVRLRDLMTTDARGEPGRLITVRVPQHVLRDVRTVAERYGSTYADTVVALLNEGLDAARRKKLL